MKIAILGTRGVPNNYGGFEQFAEYLSVGLVSKGHEVFVYSPHNHPYKEPKWKGVTILHHWDPEYRIGTAGQFIYDLNCVIDARKRNFDILLQLGYTSSSVWNFLIPGETKVLTNMDGLEWKRTKYSRIVQRFLRYAEWVAVRRSHALVADSKGIQSYLLSKFGVDSEFIPYGANLFNDPDPSVLSSFGLRPYGYNMLIARLEPENNIEMILDGVERSKDARPMLVIANTKTRYGHYLLARYAASRKIIFNGSLYDMKALNNLRYYSNLYFHGHSVGGTNPSLLEAMASHALVAASDNEFNRSVLEGDGYYFSNTSDIVDILGNVEKCNRESGKIEANVAKISSRYSWQNIIELYYSFFQRILNER